MSDLWQPLGFSLFISIAATVLVAVVGIGLAYLSAHHRFLGKTALEALFTLPLVLPPTVVGYYLLVCLGSQGWIGKSLATLFNGYSMIFRPESGVLAAAIVSLPLLYLPAKAAFSEVDPDLESAGRLMGANRFQLFWHVSLPLARGGIASGLLLAFARAIGEFGATTMVMGNFESRQTLPIYVYSQTTSGEMGLASHAVWLLSVLSLILILIYNRMPLSQA